ncbi:MAG: hypothetical protein ACTSYC_03695 [Promethearchaeota archaeon]
MKKRDKLEEKCDTLPQCEKDDGCETCEIYEQITQIDEKIEEIENKIETLRAEKEDEE